MLPRVPGRQETPTRAERFDALVLAVVAGIDERWHERLGLLEYVVEDVPLVAADDPGPDVPRVPLSALVSGAGPTPTRIVLFRRPLEHRASSREDLHALVHTVLVEQVAAVLGLDPEQVDPGYRPDEPY